MQRIIKMRNLMINSIYGQGVLNQVVRSDAEKARTPPERFSIEVTGTRRDTPPWRYTHIAIRFVIDGPGIEAVHALRAISLAFEKYCSVSASIAPDIEVTSVLVLNGEEHGS